jgi:hypothetical protein
VEQPFGNPAAAVFAPNYLVEWLNEATVWFRNERLQFPCSLRLSCRANDDAVRREFEQASPKNQVEQRPICAANLEGPSEVRFSSSLQAKGFLASGQY